MSQPDERGWSKRTLLVVACSCAVLAVTLAIVVGTSRSDEAPAPLPGGAQDLDVVEVETVSAPELVASSPAPEGQEAGDEAAATDRSGVGGGVAESFWGEIIQPQVIRPPDADMSETEARAFLQRMTPPGAGAENLRLRVSTLKVGVRNVELSDLSPGDEQLARSIFDSWSESIDPLLEDASEQLELALKDWFQESRKYGFRPLADGPFRERAAHSSAYTRRAQVALGPWYGDLSFYSEDYPYLEVTLDALFKMKSERDAQVRGTLGM
jgi:hypothetical protein